ncbi:hypothetical protein [Mucilaginibacter myungsuensis]|uniref:Uncharacterized protein n=1 Tax=Mucilaginibacter myungsuensis TaxID=649104 RepID=A0A929PWV2_9SPHI|nr:hypothetical protein [Mucilaginibacter myungsuensis]MBE9661567.1 hypothetical protein [Mucilaginibacter myungsuensis]MDN3597710.1 hypothetical protein [Mucilaginibacter myungsuensis]
MSARSLRALLFLAAHLDGARDLATMFNADAKPTTPLRTMVRQAHHDGQIACSNNKKAVILSLSKDGVWAFLPQLLTQLQSRRRLSAPLFGRLAMTA